MGKMSNRHALVFLWIVVLLAAGRLQAALWTGGGDNLSWSDPANWEPAGVPEAGAAVTNAAGAILLANATAELASFTMTGGTLTFTNWTTCLRATNVVLDGGIVTLPPPFTETQMSNRVWIVCTDFTLAAGAVIDADAKGYAANSGPGKGGSCGTAGREGGGGHGGRGGVGEYNRDLGTSATYGSVHRPETPGSGGCDTADRTGGGPGGGVIRIDAAGTASLHGSLSARGAISPANYFGGGAGGSILLSCGTLAGSDTAVVDVSGGDGRLTAAGGGGGGRIAVDYAALDGMPGIQFVAAAGKSYVDASGRQAMYGWYWSAGWGTLSLPDAALLTTVLDGRRFQKTIIQFADVNAWSVPSLTATNCAIVLGTPGLALTVANDLVVGAGADFGVGEPFGDASARLVVGNNLVVTNGGAFTLFSGQATPELDAFGMRAVVSNTVLVAANSWLYPQSHPFDGGSPQVIASNLIVRATGGVNAYGRGFLDGQGPGNGQYAASGRGSGGGYGGWGGRSDTGLSGGGVNGSLDFPQQPGSGGGQMNSCGGGVIALVADTLDLSGTLNAGGAWGGKIGGSAGGAILLQSRVLAGHAPVFNVEGGDGGSGLGGGGGGGRMALHYETLNLTGAVFRAGGGVSLASASTWNWWWAADAGTLWCATPELLSTNLTDGRFDQVRFYARDFHAWNPASLTVSNGAVTLGGDGFSLQVDGDLTVGANGMLGLGNVTNTLPPELSCAALTVMPGGQLTVYAGSTNGTLERAGARVEVEGMLDIRDGAELITQSHLVDGGAVRVHARSFQLAAGGTWWALAHGFWNQSGPGAGAAGASGRGGGGGHGGKGGDGSSSTKGGKAYGLALAPISPGSGGGSGGGGGGGGVIWLEVDGAARMLGVLNADGAQSMTSNPGGGAGGGILVAARRFQTDATTILTAVGGQGNTGHGGGGGGGRIAFWLDVPAAVREQLFDGATSIPEIYVSEAPFAGFNVIPSVAGGLGYQDGQPGTIHFVDGRPRGTVLLLR